MQRHVTATGIKPGLCCSIWDMHVCCTGIHQAMSTCATFGANQALHQSAHLLKELPGMQSACVTADFSMPMMLSVDSPTLPRLQYLAERSGQWVGAATTWWAMSAGSFCQLICAPHAAMSCKGLLDAVGRWQHAPLLWVQLPVHWVGTSMQQNSM